MVAAPRTWDELGPGLRQLEFDEVLERLASMGDPFAAIESPPVDSSRSPPVELVESPPARLVQAPDRLTTYRSMRPAKTPEPVPADRRAPRPLGNSFSSEHHARRLHYDFRLEHDGVLVSWAIPKAHRPTRR